MRFLYKITNEINGKCYIGQTKDYEKRKIDHIYDNNNSLIHNAIKKYGRHAFVFEILKKIPNDKIDEAEREAIIKYNSLVPNGYNLETGGCLNKKLSENTKQKISKAKIGKSNYIPTKETRIKTSLTLMGHPVSNETKQKISKANKGKKRDEKTRLKIILNLTHNKGAKLSDEVKQKISNALKARYREIKERERLKREQK